MPTFRITRVYQYTEVLELEASDRVQARKDAKDMEFTRIHDDSLQDEEVREVAGAKVSQ